MDFPVDVLLEKALSVGSLLLLYLVVLVFAKWFKNWTADYDIYHEIAEEHNNALGVSWFGYVLAVTFIFIGATLGPSQGLVKDLIMVAGYSVSGVLMLYIASVINDKLILYKFHNRKEIIEDQNAGTGAVQAGSFISAGLIIGAAIHGEGGGPLTAVAFFALSQVVLVVFARAYSLVIGFDVHDEIEKDNVAAGVAFGGTLIAVGIILANAVAGSFISWQDNLTYFLLNSALALVLFPIFRVVLDRIVVPKVDLNHEISVDKNLSGGIVELACTVGFALALIFLI